MTFEFFIAKRYLKAKQKEGFVSLITFLSIAGITVGVMALVVVIAVMSGAETDFRKRILGLEPHILLMSYSGKYENPENISNSLKKIKKIKTISPIVFEQTMIKTGKAFSGALLRGIDPSNSFSLIKGFTPEELQNLLLISDKKSKTPGIILGKVLAKTIGAIKGDEIILMSPNGVISPIGIGLIPSMKRFVVTGIFDSGLYEWDSSLAYVHINEAQKFSGKKNKIDALGVWVDDVFSVKEVRLSMLNFLEYPYYVRDWMEINQSLFSALKLEKTAMFVILTLIILVAAFNIASALIMMVMEKTKDIAVLKAMGATNKIIQNIFIIKGMIIGFIGVFLGTFSGIGICFLLKKYLVIKLPEAYPFSTLPVQLEYFDVIIIGLAALIICFLSTLYPSYKASRMDPVEAIRYG